MEYKIFSDEYFMQEAYKEAEKAFEKKEVPVGAIIVFNNRIVARGHNLTETLNDVTAHAEMQVFTSATNFLGAKYLNQCTLFVTLEPCIMCAGASYWTQIKKIVYGASDSKRGFSSLNQNVLHPKTEIINGVLKDKCANLLTTFFENIRK